MLRTIFGIISAIIIGISSIFGCGFSAKKAAPAENTELYIFGLVKPEEVYQMVK